MKYALQLFNSANITPGDGVTHYFGYQGGGSAQTSYDAHKVIIPVSGVITRIDFSAPISAGSGELVLVSARLNNSINVGEFSMAWNAAFVSGSSTGLSQAVLAGDTIAGRYVAPTWATNPTNVRPWMTVTIESDL